jgi:hypothetical protein
MMPNNTVKLTVGVCILGNPGVICGVKLIGKPGDPIDD